MGSSLFTMLSIAIGQDSSDRIASTIVNRHRLQRKTEKGISGDWEVKGNKQNHKLFTDEMLKDTLVKEFDF